MSIADVGKAEDRWNNLGDIELFRWVHKQYFANSYV